MRSVTDKLRDLVEASAKEQNPAVLRSNRAGGIKGGFVFDAASEGEDRISKHDLESIKLMAAASVQQWVETDDLADGESLSTRLFALMLGAADQDQDGELTDDEQSVLDTVLECAWDYLAQKGVDEEDIDLLLNEWDSDAAERIRDLIASVLPEGDDAAEMDIDAFAFGDGAVSAVMDAAYKRVLVVHDGERQYKRKRVSGTAYRTPEQKLAMKKAQRKAHSSSAKMRRKKSMKIRQKSNIK